MWLLNERKRGRRDPARAARDALHWGMPVLESRLSVIHAGRLFYAGRDAVELAGGHAIEEVAALLWRGDLAAPLPAEPIAVDAAAWRSAAALARRLPPLEGLQLFLPLVAAHDPLAFDLRPEAVRRTGARILRVLAAAAVGAQRRACEPVAACCSGAGRRATRARRGCSTRRWCSMPTTASTHRASRRAASPRPARRRTPWSPPAWRRCRG